jgi:hypothetical protein
LSPHREKSTSARPSSTKPLPPTRSSNALSRLSGPGATERTCA